MVSSELRQRPLQLERIVSVSSDATVRHVDQLETETLDRLYQALENDRRLESDVGLVPGEVIVFTDYYRIERA